MDPARLLHPLNEEPRDSHAVDGDTAFDSGVYRLGLRMLPVPGLPTRMEIGAVTAHVVEGPVLAQHTQMRQRMQLPFVFDKHMARRGFGEGELLLLLSLDVIVSDVADLEERFLSWRAQCEAAAGVLAAVLDERVAGEMVFEDVVLRHGNEVIGAADLRERIRTFLPFEVTALDTPALARLPEVDTGQGSRVARAARLLRRASLEGPTADAYLTLFVAAESILDSHKPRRRELDAIFAEAGFDPRGLPIQTADLILLRNAIVHRGLEDHPDLRIAYYELEAILRIIIRRKARLRGGWWPMQNPSAYSDDWSELVANASPPRTVWHDERLPPVSPPDSARIPRRVQPPLVPLIAKIEPSVVHAAGEDGAAFIGDLVADAHAWISPDSDPIRVTCDPPDGGPGDGSPYVINAEQIYVSPASVTDLFDAANRPKLVFAGWNLTGAVASQAALRFGVEASEAGIALIEALGAYHQFVRLISHGEFDGSFVDLPAIPLKTFSDVGQVAGWAAAGHELAADLLHQDTSEFRELGLALVGGLIHQSPFPQRPSLAEDD